MFDHSQVKVWILADPYLLTPSFVDIFHAENVDWYAANCDIVINVPLFFSEKSEFLFKGNSQKYICDQLSE